MAISWKQRLSGLVILLVGLGLTGWNWYDALQYGYYYMRLSLIAPTLAIVGIGLLLFPTYRDERIARGEDISSLQGMRLITPRWWVLLAAGLLLGMLNWWLLAQR